MSYLPRILAFAGSTRTDSFNKKLVNIAAEGARSVGAELSLIDLREFPMPLFDQDDEANSGLPANAERLRDAVLVHDGILLASPEYNGSVSAVLKNAIDWISRPHPDNIAPFSGKTAAILSASPGRLGGLRGLVHIRAILTNLNVLVLPAQIAIETAHEAFDDKSLVDPQRDSAVRRLGAELTETLSLLHADSG